MDFELTPRARIRNVQVISTLLGGELGVGVALDEVTKDRLLPLELSRLVFGIYPMENVVLLAFGLHTWSVFCCLTRACH